MTAGGDRRRARELGLAPGRLPAGPANGGGTGTRALGFKAGIGTSSRRVSLSAGRAGVVGTLVQANFGGVLMIGGAPVPPPDDEPPLPAGPQVRGSCVIVLATDVALGARDLRRLANRAFAGMARAGADFSGHSGDYALAVSTATGQDAAWPDGPVPGTDLDLLFTAAIEATEEAILNSVLMAVTMTGYRGHVSRAVPLDYLQARLAAARNVRSTGPA